MNHFFKICLLTTCMCCLMRASDAQTPLQRNQHFVAIADSLTQYGGIWIKQFQVAYKQKNWKSLETPRKAISTYVAKSIAQVTAMKVVGKDFEALRSAMLRYLAYERRMVGKDIQPVENTSPDADEATLGKLIEQLSDSTEEDQEKALVQQAQRAYAAANHFTIAH